jgi:hypothetical protein
MIWHISHRCDPEARELADRHYNRQSVGAKNFVPPGRCLVLKTSTETGRAFWVTSWPFAEYVRHAWAGAWVCSAFRNEGAGIASDMIRQAVASTRFRYPDVPELGMITFLDTNKVAPTMRRGEKTWGRTWELAGFRHCGFTKGGLMAFQLLPQDMPEPVAAIGTQESMF